MSQKGVSMAESHRGEPGPPPAPTHTPSGRVTAIPRPHYRVDVGAALRQDGIEDGDNGHATQDGSNDAKDQGTHFTSNVTVSSTDEKVHEESIIATSVNLFPVANHLEYVLPIDPESALFSQGDWGGSGEGMSAADVLSPFLGGTSVNDDDDDGDGKRARRRAGRLRKGSFLWWYTEHAFFPFFLFLVLPILVTVIGVFNPPKLDYGIESFRLANHPSARRSDAFIVAQREARKERQRSETNSRLLETKVLSVDQLASPPNSKGWPGSLQTAVDSIDSSGYRYAIPAMYPHLHSLQDAAERERSFMWFRVQLLYLPGDGNNILTPRHFEAIRDIEQYLTAADGYDEHCWVMWGSKLNTTVNECRPVNSLTTWLYPNISSRTGTLYNNGYGENQTRDFYGTLGHALNITGQTAWFLDSSYPASNASTYARATLHFALPLPGYPNTHTRRKEQVSRFESWIADSFLEHIQKASRGDVIVAFDGDEIRVAQILAALQHDMLLASASLAFIMVYFVVYTRSFWLMAFGIYQILISFPASYALYTLVSGSNTVGVMNIISLFVILGIGVDDCFVFCDRWGIIERGMDHEQYSYADRVKLLFIEAGKMTLVTSVTTAAAFGANIVSEIPAIRSFGLFMSILVLHNYFMLMTFYPAVIIIWDKYVRNMCASKPKIEPSVPTAPSAVPQLVTKPVVVGPPPLVHKSPDVDDGDTVQHQIDPNDSSYYSTDEENDGGGDAVEGPVFVDTTTSATDRPIAQDDPETGVGLLSGQNKFAPTPKAPFTQRIFDDYWSVWVTHASGKFALLAFFACATLFYGYMLTTAKTASEPPGLFASDHNIAVWDRYQAVFGTGRCDQCSGFYFSRGCDGVVGSEAVLDACGVCGGSGASCLACLLDSDCRQKDMNATCDLNFAQRSTGTQDSSTSKGKCLCTTSKDALPGQELYVGDLCTEQSSCDGDNVCQSVDAKAICEIDPITLAGSCKCSAMFGGGRCTTQHACLSQSLYALATKKNDTFALSSPKCENGAVCVNGACACVPGYTGTYCNESVPCSLSSECPGDYVCSVVTRTCQFCQAKEGCTSLDTEAVCDSVGTRCMCSEGFSGPRCTLANVCSSDETCTRNGDGAAKCVTTTDANKVCQCSSSQFTGTLCNVRVICTKDTDCRSVDGTATCAADQRWTDAQNVEYAGLCACRADLATGPKCDQVTNYCVSSSDCRSLDSTALCDTTVSPAECKCNDPKVTGKQCSSQLVCLSHSECRSKDPAATCAGTSCTCSSTVYSGSLCQIANWCTSHSDCQNGGTCSSGTCSCATGFGGNHCENVVTPPPPPPPPPTPQCTTNADCGTGETCDGARQCVCSGTVDICSVCNGDGSSCPSMTVSLDGTPATFDENQFKTDVATELAISVSQVVVESVTAGSVIVKFRVPGTGNVATQKTKLGDFIGRLTHPHDPSFRNRIKFKLFKAATGGIVLPPKVAPTLSGNLTSSTAISLSWSNSNGEVMSSWILESRQGFQSSTNFTTMATPSGNTFTHALTGPSNMRYEFRVIGQISTTDSIKSSIPSNVVLIRTPPASTPTMAPVLIVSDVTHRAAVLKIGAHILSYPLTGLEVEIKHVVNNTVFSATSPIQWQEQVSATGVYEIHHSPANYTTTALAEATNYTARARINNAAGGSPWTSWQLFKTFPANRPVALVNVQTSAVGSSTIDVSWDAPISGPSISPVQAIVIIASTPGRANATTQVDPSTTQKTLSNLLPNSPYQFHLYASNDAGAGPIVTVSVSTLPDSLPPQPETAGVVNSDATDLFPVLSVNDHTATKLTVQVTLPSVTVGVTYTSELFMSTDGGSTWQSHLNHTTSRSSPGNLVHSFSVTGLTENTVYSFKSRAHNALGSGPYSSQVDIRTIAASVPPAPTLSATRVGSVDIEVAWGNNTAPSAAAVGEFWLEWKLSSAGSFPPSLKKVYRYTGTPNPLVYTDTIVSLSPNTQYDIRVKSRNSAGYSSFTQIGPLMTAPSFAPGAPILNATGLAPTLSSVMVPWAKNPAGDPGLTNYTLWSVHCANNSRIAQLVVRQSSDPTVYNYTDSVVASTSYCFEVIAANAEGYSPSSYYTIWSYPAAVPNAPSISVTTVTTDTISITLQCRAAGDPSPGGWTFSHGERKEPLVLTTTPSGAGDSLTTSILSLIPSTTYTLRGSCYNLRGPSPVTEVNVTTHTQSPPLTPALNVTVEGSSFLVLEWTPNPASDRAPILAYELTRVFPTPATVVYNGTLLTFNHTGLTQGIFYDYVIRAFNHLGPGPSLVTPRRAYTNAVSVPDATSHLASLNNYTSSGATIIWSPPTTGDLSIFLEVCLEQGAGPSPSFSVVQCYIKTGDAVPLAMQANFTRSVVGLSADTSYSFRVRFRNSLGFGPYATFVLRSLPASPPSAPTIDSLVPGVFNVTVAWSNSTSGDQARITEYRVQYRETQQGPETATTTTISGPFTDALTTTITGLKEFTGYTFSVSARNALAYGSSSSTSAITTLPSAVPHMLVWSPSAVENVLGQGSATQRLSFSLPTSGNLATFRQLRVHQSVNGSAFTLTYTGAPSNSGCEQPGATCVVSLGNLSPLTYLEWKIQVSNDAGWSPLSQARNKTSLPANPPAAPIVTVTQVNALNATLNISMAAIGDQSPISTVKATINGGVEFTNFTLGETLLVTSASTFYLVAVRLESGAGNSAMTEVSFTTLARAKPGVPRNLNVSWFGNTNATLEFDKPALGDGDPDWGTFDLELYNCQNTTVFGTGCDLQAAGEIASQLNATLGSFRFNIYSLRPETLYRFRVRARNTVSAGNWSVPIVQRTRAAQVPAAPALTVFNVLPDNRVAIQYTSPCSPSPCVKYEIYTVKGGSWSLLYNASFVPVNTLAVDFTTPPQASDTKFEIRARVSNSLGFSPYSAANFKDLIAVAVPAPPLITINSRTSAALYAGLALNTTGDVSIINMRELEVTHPGGTVTIHNSTTASITVTDLAPVALYTLRGRARNSRGWSPWGDPTSATTLPLLRPPQGRISRCDEVTPESITVRFEFNMNNVDMPPMDHVLLWVKNTLADPPTVTSRTLTPPKGQALFDKSQRLFVFSITGLPDPGEFDFRIMGHNSAGFGSSSALCSSHSQGLAKPDAIELSVGETTATKIALTWKQPARRVSLIQIEMSTPGGVPFVREIRRHGTTLAIFDNLQAGLTYRFTARARNNAGFGGYGASVSVTTLAVGCDGVVNSGKILDQCNVCGGSGVLDIDQNCCNSTARDCEGRCGGPKEFDGAGSCCFKGDIDCAGSCGGTSIRDSSGRCCDPSMTDDCGQCFGGNDCIVADSQTGPTLSKTLNTNAVSIEVVWGIKDIVRPEEPPSGDDRLAGSAVTYDDDFDIRDPAAQVHIYEFCNRARNTTHSGLIQSSSDPNVVLCPMEGFRAWRRANFRSFPVPKEEDFIAAFTEFVKAEPEKWLSLVGFRYGGDTSPSSSNRARLLNHAPQSISFIAAVFLTDASPNDGSSDLLGTHDTWEAFMTEQNTRAPPTAKGYQSSENWSPMFSELAAVGGLFYGILIAIFAAFVCILIFTASVYITCLVVLTMVLIVIAAMGSFALFGWEFGAVEAIAITVIVGSSVDYSVHLAEGYMHHGGVKSRVGRVKESLSHVGTSVLHSAFTTIGASCMLLFTTLLVFQKFGVILVTTTLLSIIYTLAFFTAILSATGPIDISPNRGALRIRYAVIVVGILCLGAFILWTIAREGIEVQGPSGRPLFEAS